MTTPATDARCDNRDCRVLETGKCVEGLAPAECPHYQVATPTAGTGSADTAEAAVPHGLALPPTDRLATSAAAAVLRARDSRVIALVGPKDAGKTSLIACVFDLFQRGPVAGLTFARSLTLHAFERACHDARAASMRAEPHTERTGRGGVAFYHVDIVGATPGAPLALLLGDRAGEEYRSVADDPTVAHEFAEVIRADTVAFLVDGERLLDSEARHNVISEVEMVLQGLIDGGALQAGKALALVLTKLDLIETSARQDRALQDFDTLLGKVRKLQGRSFTRVEPFHTAASPKADRLPRGHGVPQLLTYWVLASELQAVANASPALAPDVRAMSRLLEASD